MPGERKARVSPYVSNGRRCSAVSAPHKCPLHCLQDVQFWLSLNSMQFLTSLSQGSWRSLIFKPGYCLLLICIFVLSEAIPAYLTNHSFFPRQWGHIYQINFWYPQSNLGMNSSMLFFAGYVAADEILGLRYRSRDKYQWRWDMFYPPYILQLSMRTMPGAFGMDSRLAEAPPWSSRPCNQLAAFPNILCVKAVLPDHTHNFKWKFRFSSSFSNRLYFGIVARCDFQTQDQRVLNILSAIFSSMLARRRAESRHSSLFRHEGQEVVQGYDLEVFKTCFCFPILGH